MFCANCGKEISENAAFCSACGTPAPTKGPTFCSNCGKELADGTAFCSACGNPVNGRPVTYAPPAYAPSEPSAFALAFKSFLNTFLKLFSKNVPETIGNQAKNTGLDWIFGIALTLMIFIFAAPVNILEAASNAFNVDIDMLLYGFPFWGMVGISIVVFALVVGALVVGMWLAAKIVSKKDISFLNALNVVSTALLPLSLCFTVNMLLGLIWTPLVLLVTAVALLMTIIWLYIGFVKLTESEGLPFYSFIILMAGVACVALLAVWLLYMKALEVPVYYFLVF